MKSINKLVNKLIAGISLKKYTVIIILCVCAMSFCASGCRQNSESDSGKQNTASEGYGHDPTFELKGTSWKFAGIVDTRTGKLEVLEQNDCEECYTLIFLTNTKADWYGLFFDDIVLKHELDLRMLGKYEIEEIGRPDFLYKFIISLYAKNTKSYSVNSNELKLINNVDKYYLLFKRVDNFNIF